MRRSDGGRWMLVREVAPRVGVTARTIQRWCLAGRVPCSRRLGGRWWIDVRALRALLVRRNEMAMIEDLG